MTKLATARAHTNIALIKYWGKENVALNIPTTSSLSLTLDQFYTTTSVEFTDSSKDELILNGISTDSTRVSKFLDLFRQQEGNFSKILVRSENHVPTAAGLASSASSFSALTGAMFNLLELPNDVQEMSRMARKGSGSASRSIFGNFAVWNKGEDDQSSYAESFYDEDINLTMIVAEISSSMKKMSSTKGMQLAQTAPTYGAWVEKAAHQLEEMKAAIRAKDIEKIGLIAQDNALGMHEQNRNSIEPFDYFTVQTRRVIDFAKQCYESGLLAFVTIDAGPNVKIITDRASETELLNKFKVNFPEIPFEVAHAGEGLRYV
ncbi:diphosphomevalonate decarboxylase [Lactococcus fujiensis]|uniref:diphosphomevalonate decarboxylase n=1 Tax=Lactococcus fujiensis JCM 16395 TaxID=1291764 RepID=A0A2A5RN85_9LACT|nr:diphosphomevalonate decarboxylase [Lactococcus fujiensis]PCS00773.1 diphosphomevalonate decarboxylase [Lactococcus fujiensis JCM 16395]